MSGVPDKAGVGMVVTVYPLGGNDPYRLKNAEYGLWGKVDARNDCRVCRRESLCAGYLQDGYTRYFCCNDCAVKLGVRW